VVGDDVKAQLGATILHRALTQLFVDRGVKVDRTYQLNVGGNTDFLNMLNHTRLQSKKISKTEAVQSILDSPLDEQCIHIGPSEFSDGKSSFGEPGDQFIPLQFMESLPNGGSTDPDLMCKLFFDQPLSGLDLPVKNGFFSDS
jgi:myo-inositol-1-phosphate synthase